MVRYRYKKQYRQYGGVIGGIAGAAIGTVIAPGIGTTAGMAIGSSIGGGIEADQKAKKAEKAQLRAASQDSSALSALQNAEMANAITPTPTFRMGGRLRYADGGTLTEFGGNTHEQGGLQIGNEAEVESGETRGIGNTKDYIFSDTLKPQGSKKTFAQLSKDIEKKHSLRKNDKFSLEAKDKELAKLAEQNEQMRVIQEEDDNQQFNGRMDELAGEFPEQVDQLRNGGNLNKGRYLAFGGELDPNNPQDYSNYMGVNNNSKTYTPSDMNTVGSALDNTDIITNNPYSGKNVGTPPVSNELLATTRRPPIGKEKAIADETGLMHKVNNVGRFIDSKMRSRDVGPTNKSKSLFTQDGNNINMNSQTPIEEDPIDSIDPGYKAPIGRIAASMAPGLISGAVNNNISKRVRYNKLSPQVYTPNQIDPRRDVQDVKTAFSSTNEAIRRNATTSGNYMSNRIASAVGEGRALDRVYSGANNTNTQILNQANQVNTQERAKIQAVNAATEDKELQDRLGFQAKAGEEFTRALSTGVGVASTDMARFEEARAASPENFGFTYIRDKQGNRVSSRIVKGSNYITAEDAKGNLYLNVDGEFIDINSDKAKAQKSKVIADRTKAIENATYNFNSDKSNK